jgi:hypothetical protein
MQQGQPVAVRVRLQAPDQHLDQFAPGAPENVVTRHGIAPDGIAALDQVDRRHELHPQRFQPIVDLGLAFLGVTARPGQRPGFTGLEFAEAHPVFVELIGGIFDAHAALFIGARQRHAAKGPQRQSAEAVLGVCIEQQDAAAAVEEAQCGDDAGNAAADDQVLGPVLAFLTVIAVHVFFSGKSVAAYCAKSGASGKFLDPPHGFTRRRGAQ